MSALAERSSVDAKSGKATGDLSQPGSGCYGSWIAVIEPVVDAATVI